LGIVVVFACLCALAASAFAGAITVARGTDAVTLDAHMIQDSPSAAISSHISETLFRLTEEGEIGPYLAESYEVDGLEWRFQIRQGISFTDGTPLNAEAVAYNLERFRTEGTFAFLLGEVESVEAVDEYTVKVTTRSPFAPL